MGKGQGQDSRSKVHKERLWLRRGWGRAGNINRGAEGLCMQASEAFMGWRGVTVCEQVVRSMVLLGAAVAWVGVVLQAAGGGGWLPPAPVIAAGLQYSQRSTTNANCTWAGLEYFQGKFPRIPRHG